MGIVTMGLGGKYLVTMGYGAYYIEIGFSLTLKRPILRRRRAQRSINVVFPKRVQTETEVFLRIPVKLIPKRVMNLLKKLEKLELLEKLDEL